MSRIFAKRAAVVVGMAAFALAVVAVVYNLNQSAVYARCADHFEQIWKALDLYVQNNAGEYPLPSHRPGRILGLELDVPHKIIDENASEIDLNNTKYWYWGYAIVEHRSGMEWIKAYRAYMLNDTAVPNLESATIWPEDKADIQRRQEELNRAYESDPSKFPRGRESAEASPSEMRFYKRLMNGVQRYFFTGSSPSLSSNLKSIVPVLMEPPELHGDGGHVLYMDGHVEFVPYPGPFPMTVEFVEGMRSLDALDEVNKP